MKLHDWLDLVQIVFYTVAVVITVLTYVKAKNGLLNAVNTEYQKKVMDRLAEISRDLLSEYDPESPTYWVREDPVKEVVQDLHEWLMPHKDEIIASGKRYPGIPSSRLERRLKRMADMIQSDPFIPRKIRLLLVQLATDRANALRSVMHKHITAYSQELAEGKHWETLDDNHNRLHNRVNSDLYKEGVGISDVEKRVHEVRNAIQDYFIGFDPLKRTVD